ncbi:hypothetical protein LUZ60_008133 [Juncus effusus]|nr:hypothetical protein LUZ60_008133 [Juncus effusus]
MEDAEKRENGDTSSEKGGKEEEQGKVSLYGLFRFRDGADVALMLVGTIAAVANGVSQPLMTVIFGQVVDAFGFASGSSDVLSRVSKVCLNFVYLSFGSGIASFLQVSCWMITGERQAAQIRGMYLEAILRQDIGFFDKELTTGQVVERMSGDTVFLQDAVGEKVGKFIQLLATFFGGFIIAFVRGWLLSLVLLSSIPPLVIAGAVMSSLISKLSSNQQATYNEAGNVVEQTIGSIRTVVSFNGEKQAVALYNKHIKKARKAAMQEGAVTGLGVGTIFFILFCSYGLAIWYGAKLVLEKGYKGGEVINVLLAIVTGAMSLGESTPCITAFAAGQTAAFRMFETINRKPEIDTYDESGESGSGKSTVINLVERFYDPQDGEVLIDGNNIKSFRLGWLREKIGLVSQEPLLFATSIRENIIYGKGDATLEEIRVATELANAARFIDKLPNGLETMVGEHGAQLSGGQKQRIAIARAILKDPRILLLDEATSALDVESEMVVQDALNRVMINKTTILVAHRLSTVKNADIISVVYRGKVVEQGPHAELIKDPEGSYSQLIKLQEIKQQEEEETTSSETLTTTKKSVSRVSSVGSGRKHSLTLSFALPGSTNFKENADTEDNKNEVTGSLTPKKVALTRLISLNKPEFPILILGSLAAMVHGVLFPILGLLLSSSITSLFEPPDELEKDVRFWTLMYVLLGAAALIFSPIEFFMFGIAGGKLVERIRALSFEQIVHQEIAWFDQPSNSSGTIGARLSVDAANVRRLVGDNLALYVQTVVTVITGFLIAMVSNWKLALIVTVVIPLAGLQGFAQIKFLHGFSADAKAMYEEASQVANGAVSGIRTVASFCAEKRVMDTYYKKCELPMRQGIRQGIISGSGFGFSFMMLYLVYSLCFYVGAQFMHNGSATFTEVFRVFFALLMTTIGVSQTSALGSNSAKAKESASSIFSILDRASKIDSSSEQGIVLSDVRGEIELQHVSFKYPLRPDVQIFTDLSLIAPSGKTVAIVGESGCGKSTVISLLERFYDPDSGSILLDGTNIQALKLSWFRQQIGLVIQEPVLFNGTIRANISYGKQGEVTEEEVVQVSKIANAHNFISSLPEGYDTSVGERGIQLSGGQKQRIAIARSILKNPKVLLLDEATSALDAESEHVVQEALDGVMVNRTTIVVAHRFSTIKGADTITVLKNGLIVEKGRHETLIGMKNGVYASLVELHKSSTSYG